MDNDFITVFGYFFTAGQTNDDSIPIVADNSSLCITLVRVKQGAVLTYDVGLFFNIVLFFIV